MRHSEPTQIADVLGFTSRVQAWREQQPWYAPLRSDDDAERGRGWSMLVEAWDDFQRRAQVHSEAAWAARGKASDDTAERLGIGTALAEKVRRSTFPGQRPAGVNKALGWWQRSTKSLLVAAAGDADEALLAAAVVVWRGNGLLCHANELQRRQREQKWFDELLGARVLALTGLYAGEGERTFVEASLHELLEVRRGAALRTVLVSPLDRTALVAAVAPAVRAQITGPDMAWLWASGKEGA